MYMDMDMYVCIMYVYVSEGASVSDNLCKREPDSVTRSPADHKISQKKRKDSNNKSYIKYLMIARFK